MKRFLKEKKESVPTMKKEKANILKQSFAIVYLEKGIFANLFKKTQQWFNTRPTAKGAGRRATICCLAL